jgi:tape measure domain-containing protein
MATDPKIRYDIQANAQGAQGVEQLAGELERLDASIDPALASRAQLLSAELRKLGDQQAAVERFIALKRETEGARQALTAAQGAAQQFGRELASVEAPTRAQAGQLQKLRDAVRSAKDAYSQQASTLQAARSALTQAGIDTTQLASAQRTLATQSDDLARRGQNIVRAYQAQGTAATESATTQAAAHRRIGDGVRTVADQLETLRNLSIAGLVGGQTAQLLQSVTETADAYQNLSSRIRLVTGDGAAFEGAMQGVYEVATRTNSTLEGTGTLFTRIAQAGREIGLGQQQALALTETINQAVQISGASAQASDAAITQLIQGLQSGVLRGEEFNSVMEQAPRLAQALAIGLGVTTGQLRNLAQQGQLTSTTVIRALQSQSATLQAEFGQLPATVGRAITNLQTEWLRFIGTLDQSSGATSVIAQGINTLASNLDTVARLAGIAGAALTANLAVRGAQALRAFAVEAAAAAGATNLLSASISKIPAVINITVAAVGFEVGFQIGQMLHDNSELARKLGVGLVAFFELTVSHLQGLKETATAIFTDDTVAQATERYRQRAEQILSTSREMWRDAEQAPSKVAAAADAAAQSSQTMAMAATGAATQIAQAGTTAAAGVGAVAKAAETAQGAIAALAQASGIQLPLVGATVRQQAQAMAELANQSSEVAARLKTELPEALTKLSGPELDQFRSAFIGALQGAGDQAQLLQTVLVATGRRAAEALGVDVVRASSTVSQEFSRANDSLSVLVRSLDVLKRSGVDTATVLRDALAKMVDGARNQAELDTLRQRIEALGKAGQLSRPQLEELFDSIRRKADEAKQGVNTLDEAMRVFGLQSRSDMQKVADTFGQAWNRIRHESTLTLSQKQEAFRRYADAAIAANGGVVTSELRAQAEMLKLKLGAEAAGQGITTAMGPAQQALDAVTVSAERAAAAARGAAEAGRIGSGFSEAKSHTNGSVTYDQNDALFSLQNKARAGTLSAADLAVAQAALQAATANLEQMQANQDVFSLEGQRSVEEAYRQARQLFERVQNLSRGGNGGGRGKGGGLSGAGGNTPTLGGGQSGAGGLRRTVTIQINGKSTPVGVASDEDADALTHVLRQIQSAAGRSSA